MSISILLADDQPMLRLGFRLVLDAQEDMQVIGEAGDGAAALRLVQAKHPDVVLMDVRMRGRRSTRHIRRPRAPPGVLDSTSASTPAMKPAEVAMCSRTSPNDLLSAIRAVATSAACWTPSTCQPGHHQCRPR